MPSPAKASLLAERETLFCLLLVILLSFLTYVPNFGTPAAFFWDENYHIASAQKYLNGTFFMEPHPPLGKLLIAAGEALLNQNPTDTQFISTDYGKDPPSGFSFTGYRLFPVLLAWLTAPILFLALTLALKNPILALLSSFFYVFDNALIVHLRGAMLEPPYLFGTALTILAFLLLLQWKDIPRRFLWASVLFGLGFSIVMTTKVLGLVLILVVPILAWTLRSNLQQFLTFCAVAAVSFAVPYLAIWQLHFSLATHINPTLPDQGYYQASAEYKALLSSGKTLSLSGFPVMLRDSLAFTGHYAGGVPRLDLCKADENGSPAFLWPIGGRSINYRWETPDGTAYQYLYLQINPIIWWGGFLGVILSMSLLLASAVLPLRERLKSPLLLFTFLALYGGFMVAVSRLPRVMYLYHYFLPLLFSVFLLGLALLELKRFLRWNITDARRTMLFLFLGIFAFASFHFFRPLSYYEPITDEQFKRRMILPTWELRCVHCPRTSPFVATTR